MPTSGQIATREQLLAGIRSAREAGHYVLARARQGRIHDYSVHADLARAHARQELVKRLMARDPEGYAQESIQLLPPVSVQ